MRMTCNHDNLVRFRVGAPTVLTTLSIRTATMKGIKNSTMKAQMSLSPSDMVGLRVLSLYSMLLVTGACAPAP